MDGGRSTTRTGPVAVLVVAGLVLLGLLLIEFLARDAPSSATADTNKT